MFGIEGIAIKTKRKIAKTVCTVVLCGALCCIFAGGALFYARHGTAIRQTKIKAHDTYRLSAFTEIEQRETIVLCAQRGLSAQYPENTLPAVRAACEAGYPYILLDTAMTRDEKPVLLADDSIERMTTGRGQVRACTFDALRKFPIDNGAGIERQEQPLFVPALEEALALCRDYGATPLLTVRTLRGLDALADTMKRFGQDYGVVSSRKAVLESWRGDDCLRLYRTDALTQRDVRYAQKTGCGLLVNGPGNTPSMLRLAQESVPLWAENVHSRIDLRNLAQCGVTQIVTDCILPIR